MLTFNTHIGLLQFSKLCFGLDATPAICQRTIKCILARIQKVGCYLDDNVVKGNNDEEYINLLRIVFQRLSDANINLKTEKIDSIF